MPTTATIRRLRRNSTDAERLLWSRLRNRELDGLKFKRQVEIAGKVADFACADARLVIELDGSQHSGREVEDGERTRVLAAAGYLVLRFWNNEVLTNLDGVLEVILGSVVSARRNPSPCPSPHGRGND